MSAVHQILSMQSVFNSYVDFVTEKSRACLYGQDRGSQMNHKRAIRYIHKKKISCQRSNCSLIRNAILDQLCLKKYSYRQNWPRCRLVLVLFDKRIHTRLASTLRLHTCWVNLVEIIFDDRGGCESCMLSQLPKG